MRIDVWDADQAKAASDLGFQRGLEESYELLGELGKGGFGLVQVARCKQTGEELACKAIAKQLPDICDPARNAKHQANIKREVAVLQALKGSLNVANIEQVSVSCIIAAPIGPRR